MDESIWVAVLSLVGTLTGSLGGVMAANRLTIYRLSELEKKVEAHNRIVERTVVLERDLSSAWREIGEIKKEVRG